MRIRELFISDAVLYQKHPENLTPRERVRAVLDAIGQKGVLTYYNGRQPHDAPADRLTQSGD